jgi:hypothetical protein
LRESVSFARSIPACAAATATIAAAHPSLDRATIYRTAPKDVSGYPFRGDVILLFDMLV